MSRRNGGDFTAVLERAQRRGWTATITRGGHVKLVHKDGGIYFTARTPSDWRAARNVECALRRIEQGRSVGAH